jgi:hypothetical protein
MSGFILTATTLNNAGAAITLDSATNALLSVNLRARNAADTANAAGAITYVDTNSFDVAGISTTSTVNLTGGGAITDSGTLTGSILTAKTLNNGGSLIALDTANNFTTVNLSARNAADTANAAGAITYGDTNGFDVSGINTTSTVNLTGGGAITQSGAIIASDLVFSAGGAVTLNQTANSFDSVTGTAGGDINIKDSVKPAVEVKALTALCLAWKNSSVQEAFRSRKWARKTLASMKMGVPRGIRSNT